LFEFLSDGIQNRLLKKFKVRSHVKHLNENHCTSLFLLKLLSSLYSMAFENTTSHICSFAFQTLNNLIKIQDEEQEECVTEENSGAEDEKDVTNDKEQRKHEALKKKEEGEEEESEEEEEAVTEEEDNDEEDDDEDDDDDDEQDNKLKPEPSQETEAQSRADTPMLLKPQRVEPMRLTPPPPPADPNAMGNPTVVDEALQRALGNDPELTEVNLNNIDDISQVRMQTHAVRGFFTSELLCFLCFRLCFDFGHS